jgi:hypothetical protein
VSLICAPASADRLPQPPHRLLWVAQAPGGAQLWSDKQNWADLNDGKNYTPIAGDSLTFDPTRKAGMFQGSKTPSINDLPTRVFANLTVASGYGAPIFLRVDVAFKGTVDIDQGDFRTDLDAHPSATRRLLILGAATESAVANTRFHKACLQIGSETEAKATMTIGGNLSLARESKLIDYGTTVWREGDITLDTTSSVVVAASGDFDIQCDKVLVGDAAALAIWKAPPAIPQIRIEGGTMRKSLGGRVTEFKNSSCKMQNNAQLGAHSGTIRFTGTPVRQDSGTITLNGGSLATNGRIDLHGGLLQGIGTLAGEVNNVGGVVCPGFSGGMSGGRLNVAAYTQGGNGTLAIQLLGGGPGASGYFHVHGPAVLGGILQISRSSKYTPGSGVTTPFLQYKARRSDFATKKYDDDWASGGVAGLGFIAEAGPLGAGEYQLKVIEKPKTGERSGR